MNRLIAALGIALLLGADSGLLAQSDTTVQVIISGKVRDENDQPVANAIIINQRTKMGVFGRPDGSFAIRCQQTDTLSLTSLGYHTRTLTCKDSVAKATYNVGTIYLDTRVYRMGTVEIFGQRDLEKIQQDIQKLGYNERDFTLSGLNAMQSPITFLYQQFSRTERSKRLVAEMENADRKRDLLKELFKYYVDYQIIDLSNDQFDDFIEFLNVSDEFMKNSTQYDFLIYVRDRFKDYKVKLRQKNTLKESDFNYDKD